MSCTEVDRQDIVALGSEELIDSVHCCLMGFNELNGNDGSYESCESYGVICERKDRRSVVSFIAGAVSKPELRSMPANWG